MNANTESSTMKMNNKRFNVRKRPTKISLPNIKEEETSINNFNIFKDMNRKQLHLPNPSTVVEEWLDEFQTNKRVQFSKNVTVVSKSNKSRKTNQTKSHLLPIGDRLTSTNQQSNFFPPLSTERINNQSKNISTSTAAITESALYRSTYNRTLSISTITSSPRSSLSSNTLVEQAHAASIISSIQPSSSLITASTNKVRLSSLEFNSSLSEFDRKKLDDIRQIVADEFEKLVPILIKLGVIIVPNKFFQDNNKEEMTKKELIERHHLISLMKKDEENIEYKRHLEDLYGSVVPNDNKDQVLRGTLSFQGQLALLASYQDEIERELNKKIKYWKTIPMQSIRTNLSEYSYSTNKSSLIENSFEIRKKSIKSNSSIKSNTDLSLTIDENSFEILIPDHIDNQWKRKSIVHIIEEGMILLDKVRLLSSSILPNISSNEQFIQDTIYDINKLNLVKAFKRWLFLCSNLYAEEKYII